VLSMLLGWTTANGWQPGSGQLIAMIVVAALGIFFAFAGGMHAVIWTDVVQFFILMGGVIAMSAYAFMSMGSVSETFSDPAVQRKFQAPELFDLTSDLTFVSALLLGFIEMLSSSGSDQVVLQTYLTARSEKEAKQSLWRNGLILKPLSLMFPLLGLMMFIYYHQHPEVAAHMRVPDDALSVFIVNVLPQGLRGLMVVAILSAVVDSVASGMTASSAVVQVDFVRRWRREPLSDRGAVVLARSLIFFWGILIILASIWVLRLGRTNNIIQILNIIMYPFAGVLLGIFLLGLLSHRANARGAFVGACIGFVVTVAVPLSNTVLSIGKSAGWSLPAAVTEVLGRLGEVSNFYYGALGAAATVLVGWACSLLFPPPTPVQLQGLTRRSLPPPPTENAAVPGPSEGLRPVLSAEAEGG
jgi:Na+/proline symporter